MKRVFAMVMAVVMAAVMFAGCSAGGNNNASNNSGSGDTIKVACWGRIPVNTPYTDWACATARSCISKR